MPEKSIEFAESFESIAYKIMVDISTIEGGYSTRDQLFEAFSEALIIVKGGDVRQLITSRSWDKKNPPTIH